VAEQENSRKLMKELFGGEIEDRSVAGRKALALKLLDEAAKTTDAPADVFVVLGGAIQSAMEAGDLSLAFEAAERMSGAYDVDGLSLKASVAAKMAIKGYAMNVAENVPSALALLDPLISADDPAAASRIVSVLQQVPVADPPLRVFLQKRAREVEEIRAARDRLGPALAKLTTSPDDPAANLAVGRYTALLCGDWAKGLPMLVKSDDPELQSLARRDLGASGDAAAQGKLANDWWAAVYCAAKEGSGRLETPVPWSGDHASYFILLVGTDGRVTAKEFRVQKGVSYGWRVYRSGDDAVMSVLEKDVVLTSVTLPAREMKGYGFGVTVRFPGDAAEMDVSVKN
jgi:hypothetical protein